jgi:hypothetical protein
MAARQGRAASLKQPMETVSAPRPERNPNPQKPHKAGPAHRRGRALAGDHVRPTAATRYSVYSGTDRLGSYRRVGTVFEAFDRLGRSLGTFPTEREAIASIDGEATP